MPWVGRSETSWRLRLGTAVVQQAGQIQRSLELETTAGYFTASDISVNLHNPFLILSPNVKDSIFNNLRILDAKVAVQVGVPSRRTGGTQWFQTGIWYVDEWGMDTNANISFKAHDQWKQLNDRPIQVAIGLLGSELSVGSTTIPITSNPSTGSFSNSGTLLIGESEYVTYTGTTTSTFTGATRGAFNSPAGTWGTRTPVVQAYVNVAVDSLMKTITEGAGLGSGEVSLSTPGFSTDMYFDSDRRGIKTTNGSAVNELMDGDNGAYGLVGATVPFSVSWSPFVESVGFSRRILGTGAYNTGIAVAKSVKASKDIKSLVDSSAVLYPYSVLLFDDSYNPFAGWFSTPLDAAFVPAVQGTLSGQTALWAAYVGSAGSSVHNAAPQFGMKKLSPAAVSSPYQVYYSGLSGSANGSYSIGSLPWPGVVSAIPTDVEDPPEAGQTGPAAMHYEANTDLIYVAYHKDTAVKVVTFSPKTDGTIDYATKATVMAANTSYMRATGICRIADTENPLGNSLVRWVIACTRISDGAYVLLRLAANFTVLDVSVSTWPVIGVGFSITQGQPTRTRIVGMWGGWDHGTSYGPKQLAFVASFDMLFQHPQVRLTTDTYQPAASDPKVYVNGTQLTSGTANDYRLDRGGNYAKISFEKLWTNADLFTATYEYRSAVAIASFGGQYATDVMKRAAAVVGYWLYFDAFEKLWFRPRMPYGPPVTVFLDAVAPPSTGQGDPNEPSPNVQTLSARQSKDQFRTQATVKYRSMKAGAIEAQVTVDESNLAKFSGSQLTYGDLYGTRSFEASNEWINSESDAQQMATAYLSALSLRTQYSFKILFRPDLELTDNVLIYSKGLSVGPGSASAVMRPNMQITSLTQDLDSWDTSGQGMDF